jgi:3-ketosteroid 9alpha-monooxygenase subunit B
VAHHSLRIARVVQETADARSFAFDVPAELVPAFRYKAGQFLTFRVPWKEGETLLRCYSLSSAPESDPQPVVTVKRVEDGRVSNWFHDCLRQGDALDVMLPSGLFVLRDTSRPLFGFAGGSGITPLLSLLKSALRTTQRRMKLLYANRDRDSIIFRRELDVLVGASGGRLEVVHHLDDERGFLTAREIIPQVRGFEDAHFYVCGPGPMMELVEQTLAGIGVVHERVFIERFVSLPSEEDAARDQAEAAKEAAGLDHPLEITVQLDGKRHVVPYTEGESVLAAARKAGLEPPFACEDGYCGSCAARRVRGDVVMRKNEVFSAAEVAAGHVLTCQARPCGRELEVTYD